MRVWVDLTDSACTMHRDAIALGAPVFTTFERRPAKAGLHVRRGPGELVRLLLAASEP
jgi:hypothetical protein